MFITFINGKYEETYWNNFLAVLKFEISESMFIFLSWKIINVPDKMSYILKISNFHKGMQVVQRLSSTFVLYTKCVSGFNMTESSPFFQLISLDTQGENNWLLKLELGYFVFQTHYSYFFLLYISIPTF